MVTRSGRGSGDGCRQSRYVISFLNVFQHIAGDERT